jgi:hypothetical protein
MDVLPKLSHQESKDLYLRYRKVAQDLTRSCNPVISVSQHANVQMIEDGAYVESLIWIPKEALDESS